MEGRSVTWHCPLCNFTGESNDDATSHALAAHANFLRRNMGIPDVLRRILDLITEVKATEGHPNPSGEKNAGGSGGGNVMRVPIDVNVFTALRPVDDPLAATTDPGEAINRCVNIAWNTMDDELRKLYHFPTDPALPKNVEWLLLVWPHIEGLLNELDNWMITSEVRTVLIDLARIAKTRPNPRVPCLVDGCGGYIYATAEKMGGYDWPDLCENGHDVDRYAVARQWEDEQLLSLRDCARKLTPRTEESIEQTEARIKRCHDMLCQWVKRGRLEPDRIVGKRKLYRLSTIKKCAQKRECSQAS